MLRFQAKTDSYVCDFLYLDFDRKAVMANKGYWALMIQNLVWTIWLEIFLVLSDFKFSIIHVPILVLKTSYSWKRKISKPIWKEDKYFTPLTWSLRALYAYNKAIAKYSSHQIGDCLAPLGALLWVLFVWGAHSKVSIL